MANYNGQAIFARHAREQGPFSVFLGVLSRLIELMDEVK